MLPRGIRTYKHALSPTASEFGPKFGRQNGEPNFKCGVERVKRKVSNAVFAFVQLVSGAALTIEELAEYASRNLVPYKRPSKIEFVPAMPLTPTGKVIKDDLAKMFAFSPAL